MDLIIEFILELFLEGTIEISSNKKTPKWIRYPLTTIIVLFTSIMIIGIFYLGIIIYKDNILFSLILILFGIIFLISGINKLKKQYLEKKIGNNDNHN